MEGWAEFHLVLTCGWVGGGGGGEGGQELAAMKCQRTRAQPLAVFVNFSLKFLRSKIVLFCLRRGEFCLKTLKAFFHFCSWSRRLSLLHINVKSGR